MTGIVGWLLAGKSYLCHCEERSDVAISCHSGADFETVPGDCHAPLGLAMTACFRLVLLLLPGQLSGMVGGVMTPPYRG